MLVVARFQRELETELQRTEMPPKTVDLGPPHVSKNGTRYYVATREAAREAAKEERSIGESKGYRAQLKHFMSHYPNRFDSLTIKACFEKLPPEKKSRLMEQMIEVLGRPPKWEAE